MTADEAAEAMRVCCRARGVKRCEDCLRYADGGGKSYKARCPFGAGTAFPGGKAGPKPIVPQKPIRVLLSLRPAEMARAIAVGRVSLSTAPKRVGDVVAVLHVRKDKASRQLSFSGGEPCVRRVWDKPYDGKAIGECRVVRAFETPDGRWEWRLAGFVRYDAPWRPESKGIEPARQQWRYIEDE